MKEEFIPLTVQKNDNTHRFELTVNGYTALIDFKEKDNVVKLIYTESPEELAGRGVATALIEKTLVYLETHNYSLVPLCPLVFAYIKRHTEWKRIVDASFNGFN